MKTPWVVVALWLAAGSAGAQQQAPVALDTIVVTPTRGDATLLDAARSVSVVDAERIQLATQQLALDEALAGVPGLYAQNRYNFAQDLRIALRGFGARAGFGIRGIRVVVDGIPETLPDGQASVDSIDLGSTRGIEVLRGPASALYGNAAGGVIAVTSELGSGAPRAEGRVAGGEGGYSQWQLKSLGNLAGSDTMVNVSQTRLDGFREQSRLRSSVVNGKLGTRLGASGRLLLSLNLSEQPESQDAGGLTAAQAAAQPGSANANNIRFDAGEELEQQRLGALYRHDDGFGQLSLRLHGTQRDFTNRLPFLAGGAVALDRLYLGGGAQYDIAGIADVLGLTLGFDYDRQDDARQRYDNIDGQRGTLVFEQDEDVDSVGAFVHGRYSFAADWALQAGLRFDELAYDVRDRYLADGDDSGQLAFRAWSPSLSLARRVGSGVLFLGYGRAFEAPTTTELANPDGSGGFNAALEPQRADSLELGWRQGGERWFGEVALFAIDLENELVPFQLPASPGRTFYANAGSSSRRGVETAWSWKPAPDLAPGLALDLSYTWSDFSFDRFSDTAGQDFSGKRLPGLPEHFGHVGLRFRSARGLSAVVEANYSGQLYADNANAVEVASYTVANLRLAQDIQLGSLRLTPSLGLNNLLDESYYDNVRINAAAGRYYEPAPGRNVYAGVTIQLGGTDAR